MSTNHKVSLVRTVVNAVPPSIATRGSFGYDLHTTHDEFFWHDFDIVLARTGFKLAADLPADVAMLVLPRSSLPLKHRLIVPNSPGLVDRDYAGELMVELMSLPRFDTNGVREMSPYVLPAGTKVAQLLFVRVALPVIELVDEVNPTRDRGGFGSTGT